MKINEYLEVSGLSYTSLAKILGVSSNTTLRWIHGSVPRYSLLKKLEKITSGKITAASYGYIDRD